jgi:hypothetical protein
VTPYEGVETFCGSLEYVSTFDSTGITESSSPASIQTEPLDILFYSEEISLIGSHEIKSIIRLKDYPDVSDSVSVSIKILNPCINPQTFEATD